MAVRVAWVTGTVKLVRERKLSANARKYEITGDELEGLGELALKAAAALDELDRLEDARRREKAAHIDGGPA